MLKTKSILKILIILGVVLLATCIFNMNKVQAAQSDYYGIWDNQWFADTNNWGGQLAIIEGTNSLAVSVGKEGSIEFQDGIACSNIVWGAEVSSGFWGGDRSITATGKVVEVEGIYADSPILLGVGDTCKINLELSNSGKTLKIQFGSVSDNWGEVYTLTKYIPTYALKAASASYNSIKLTWNKLNYVTGYTIYRSTDNKTFKKIATVGDVLTYTDKSLTTGKKYYYKVKATSEIIETSYSEVVSTKPVPKKVTATVKSASYNSIKVSWGKISGSSGYEVYRATSASGTYKKVKTTTAASFTNGSLTTGKAYYYKVRAYKTVSGKKIYGPYSAVVNVKPTLKKPTLTAKKATATSIKTSWKKIAGASGYEILVTKDNIESQKFTIKKGTAVSGTITKLPKGSTYTIKVRAYRTVSGKKVYSSYSAVKTVKL